jgi:hypothetical protein
MNWSDGLVFFEGEDPVALKLRYIEMRAIYPEETPFGIAQYVFKDCVDPTLRANQCSLIWENDLQVKEDIREKKRRLDNPSLEMTKEQWDREVLKTALDPTMDYRDKKAKTDALALYAKGQSAWIIAPSEAKGKDDEKFARPKQFVIKKYDD